MFMSDTKISEVNSSAFMFCLIIIFKLLCKMNVDKLASEIFVYKTLRWALYYLWFQNIVELYVGMNLLGEARYI